MITFLNMAFLVGLPAVGLPVLVHLLSRRRQEVIDWGAMKFLMEAMPRRRRWFQLDDRLLMLLRCLMVLLFVLALARPMLRSRLWGSGTQRDVVVVLDASLSTARTEGTSVLFDRLRDRALEIIGRLNPADRVRVLVASQTPQWILDEWQPAGAARRDDLRIRLASIKPSQASPDWPRCIEEATASFDNAQSAHAIIVVTDEQAYGWRADASVLWRQMAALLDKNRGGPALSVVTVAPTQPSPGELAIVSITSDRSRVGIGEPITVSATVRNTGTTPTQATTVRWTSAGTPAGASPVRPLQPGESVSVDAECTLSTPGVNPIDATIVCADSLPADNHATRLIEVPEAVPVLIVTPAPPKSASAGATDRAASASSLSFLLAALGREGRQSVDRWQSVFSPHVISPTEMGHIDVEAYACIVLLGVTTIDNAARDALDAGVRAGGGLWIIPGDATNLAAFNAGFGPDDATLLPARLGNPVGDAIEPEHAEHFAPPLATHAATRLISDTQRLDLDRVEIHQRYPLLLADRDKDTSVLVRTADGSPVLIERVRDRGRIILQGLPLDRTCSTLPISQAFVVWTNELLNHLASGTSTRRHVAIGEEFTLRSPGSWRDVASVSTPDGDHVAISGENIGADRLFRWPITTAPGVYELTRADSQNRPVTDAFIVERDASESDLTPLTAAQRQALSSIAGVTFGDAGLDVLGPAHVTAPRDEPAWTALLIALLAIAAIEMLLAARLSRKRGDASGAIDRETVVTALRRSQTARTARA